MGWWVGGNITACGVGPIPVEFLGMVEGPSTIGIGGTCINIYSKASSKAGSSAVRAKIADRSNTFTTCMEKRAHAWTPAFTTWVELSHNQAPKTKTLKWFQGCLGDHLSVDYNTLICTHCSSGRQRLLCDGGLNHHLCGGAHAHHSLKIGGCGLVLCLGSGGLFPLFGLDVMPIDWIFPTHPQNKNKKFTNQIRIIRRMIGWGG